jgi:hypothetical protein
MKYKIGQIVKSMDFPTRADCYMIGVIESIDETYEKLTLKTLRIVSQGEKLEVNDGDQFHTHYGPDMFDKHYTHPRLKIMGNTQFGIMQEMIYVPGVDGKPGAIVEVTA